MVLAPVVAVQFVRAALQGSHMTRRRLLGVAGISISSALIVSAPFWLPVVVRYHGHVANRAPGDFVWPPLASGREATTPGSPYGGTNATNILQFLKEFFWRWPMLVIAVGLSLWIAGRIGRKRKVTPSSPTATLGAPRSIGCDAVWIVTTWTIWSFVGLLIFIYSIGYMAHDENFTRFFCFLSLFAAAMLGVVIANSLLLLERPSRWPSGSSRGTGARSRSSGNRAAYTNGGVRSPSQHWSPESRS